MSQKDHLITPPKPENNGSFDPQDTKILVVDDDPIISGGVRDFLVKNGFKVLVGNNGQQGLDLWKENRDVQIILTDMMMPLMTGADLIKEVRKIDSIVHIIVLSGVTAVESVVDCLRQGANNYLEKPFKPSQVLASIRDQLTEIENEAKEREQSIINQLLIEASLLVSDPQISYSNLAESVSNLIQDCIQCSFIAALITRNNNSDVEIAYCNQPEFIAKTYPSISPEKINSWIKEQVPFIDNIFVLEISHKNEVKGFLIVSGEQKLFSKDLLYKSFLNQLSSKIGFLFDHLQKGLSIDASQLEQASPKLLQLAMVGELSASIVHDIANPLTVANYYLQKLQDSQGVDANGLLCIEKIAKSLSLVTSIVQSFNHLMNGGKQSPKSVTTLYNILESGTFVLSHKIRKNKASVVIECNVTDSIECVKSQIEQVVINMLSNALDATEKVANKEIVLRAKMLDSITAQFEICNHGPPIPQEIRDRIFQKFFTTKPAGKGTGLGLHISTNIVKSYGGEITCYDDDQQRTVFRFTIKSSQ